MSKGCSFYFLAFLVFSGGLILRTATFITSSKEPLIASLVSYLVALFFFFTFIGTKLSNIYTFAIEIIKKMKNILFILIAAVLFGCHKDSTTSTPAPVHSSPPSPPDTFTTFFITQLWIKDKNLGTIVSFTNRIDSLNLYSNSADNYLLYDSIILCAYSHGWYRLPVYDNSLSAYYGLGQEYITHYPADTLIYTSPNCPCSGNPLSENPRDGRIYIQLMYQTYNWYRHISSGDTIFMPKDSVINMKLFIKPNTSSLMP